ncbi:DUF389 domain-containing protein [Qipengyuania sp. NPDC077563]|uniref:DUF389 domain-containing protein n=1 Tax=Qipengyuania sp. NPDC077563 TaxID=3364497 RepID=UPI00384B230A
MRQLSLNVLATETEPVLRAAETSGLTLFAQVETLDESEERRMLIFEAPNAQIEDFLRRIESAESLRVILAPQGIISLRPPASEPERQMLDIQARSPLEVFLGALQSIGSWPGLIGYAVTGGVIVWIGLFTESVFLLVAAMLIAPFAGPAMTAAIATARGDGKLLWRSLIRYVVALFSTILTTFLLSRIFDQKIATGLMIETSMRSSVSLLLPLAAGVAGALNLVQSERSSLVSGAATGMLVAAALAPPAGLVGMGLAIGQMDIVISSLWALSIQMVGINIAGFVVFRIYGMSTSGARYPRGKSWLSAISLLGSVVCIGVLIAVQFSGAPQFQQSSVAQRISAEVQKDLEAMDGVTPVSVESRFTRNRPQGQNPVWISIRVEASLSAAEERILSEQLAGEIERDFDVRALVELAARS